jgi:hypothetical protein
MASRILVDPTGLVDPFGTPLRATRATTTTATTTAATTAATAAATATATLRRAVMVVVVVVVSRMVRNGGGKCRGIGGSPCSKR